MSDEGHSDHGDKLADLITEFRDLFHKDQTEAPCSARTDRIAQLTDEIKAAGFMVHLIANDAGDGKIHLTWLFRSTKPPTKH